MNQNLNYQKIQHLHLAAFLVARGHTVQKTMRDPTEKLVYFLFENTPLLTEDIDAHFSNSLIPCMDYSEALTKLKDMIFRQMRPKAAR